MADCWCGAVGYSLCPECEGSDDGCWRCAPHWAAAQATGLIPALPTDTPAVVVHEDVDP